MNYLKQIIFNPHGFGAIDNKVDGGDPIWRVLLMVMTGVRVYTLLNFHNAMSGYPSVSYKGGGFKSKPSTVNLNASFRE